jgi:hypothetical protein
MEVAMSIRRLLVPLVALFLLGPGCGGDSSSGGGASTQASGFLTINAPSDVIKCGACQPFTATYTKGGAGQTVTPTWRTDNTAVATIDASGQLTPIAHGDVTVIAEYQGANASKLVHVVNDYGATWYGNYVITRCQATYGAQEVGMCDSDGFAVGNVFPLGLEFQQDRDRVTGTLWLGQLSGPFTGSVASGGNLTGEAKIAWTVQDGVIDVLVSPFSMLRESDRISDGHFTVLMTIAGDPGTVTFDARIMGLEKASSGRSSLRQAPAVPRSLRDVPRLMRQQ